MDCKKELTQRDECTGSQANCDGNNSGICHNFFFLGLTVGLQ